MKLETAKELNWEFETEFYYCSDLGEKVRCKNCEPYKPAECGQHTPMPSLEEMLEKIPHYISISYGKKIMSVKGRYTNEMFLHIDFMRDYKAYYSDAYGNELKGLEFTNTDCSEAVALLIIKLKKENLWKQ